MQQERRTATRRVGQGPGFALQVWLWAVPSVMLAVSLVLAAVAAAGSRWPLFGIMLFIALFALALLMLHYWALYRFGRKE